MTTGATNGSPAVRFEVLGPLRVWRDGAELDLGPRQQRLILALLLARAGQPVSITEFLELLWDKEPPARAVNVLHRGIGTLRRLLEPGLPARATGSWLVRQAAGYRLLADGGSLDLLEARQLAERAREAGADALPLHLRALELWRGSCAGGAELLARPHPAFEAVNQEHATLARHAAEEALLSHRAGEILPAIRRAAARHPLDEALQARLLLLLSADGKQADAITAYHGIRERLADELGIDPGEELRSAYRDILHQRDAGSGVDSAPPPVRPAQLPPDLPFFSGRDEVLRRARERIDGHDSGPGVAILAVDGIPGIGKTALVTHLAHQLAGWYPDGQLYVDLRGFDADGAVLDPAEAVQGFLSGLGVAQTDIPLGLPARSGLYRSVLAGRRVLVVLDNAHDVEQVRHLLPGSPSCLVLVTSRNRLTGLATAHGAELITLDVPTLSEARTGFETRIGASRARAEQAALDEIIDRCGRLPLALALVAARAVTHADHRLSAIAQELREAQGSLDGFSGDLRAIFSWSYQRLSPRAAQAFRLTPVHPGPDITLPALAALVGGPPREARALAGELLRTRLFTEHAPGRFSTHDLIRAYATELGEDSGEEAVREQAQDRLLQHYLQTAYRAQRLLDVRMVLGPPPDVPGAAPAEIADVAQATAWFAAERLAVKAMVARAIDTGRIEAGWRLALTLQCFYQREGRWLEWAETVSAALAGAVAAGDAAGEAYLLRSLAGARHYMGDSDEARELLRRALVWFEQPGFLRERALITINLGRIDYDTKNYAAAAALYERALELLGDHEEPSHRANALLGLADSLIRLGRQTEGVRLIQEALLLHRETGDVNGEGLCHDSLAHYHDAQGDFATSLVHRRLARELFRRVDWRPNLVDCYIDIGYTAMASGDTAAARAARDEGLALLRRLPEPRSAEAEDRLVRLSLITGPAG